MKLRFVLKGGAGSGHYGHAGRPGKEGGSVLRSISNAVRRVRNAGVYDELTTSDDPVSGNELGLVYDPDDVERFSSDLPPTQRKLRIDPALLRGTVGNLDRPGLLRYINNPQSITAEPIEVIRSNGKFYITDGNHRVVAAMLLGIQELEAVISSPGNPVYR